MKIANPLYVSVLKYFLDDNRVAKVLISNTLDLILINVLHFLNYAQKRPN